ncbi:hypothetical protein [Bauldia sp.]|uniref:hypothetical protein n=1 Tax=Bauldia sp. TaxID=2575872 RepID=UPI003BA9EA94
MKPCIEYFHSYLLYDADQFLRNAVEGELVFKNGKIVVKNEDGAKLIIVGDLEMDANGVISGTANGFKVKDRDTKVLQGDGFDIDIADVETALGDSNPYTALQALIFEEKAVVKGSHDADFFFANEIDVIVRGRQGDDQLYGGAGHQVLKGGRGNDFLLAFQEADKLKGGADKDTFAFVLEKKIAGDATTAEAESAHKIKDFSHNDDTILLDRSSFPLEEGFLDDDLFHVGESATSPDHRVVYDMGTGILRFDPDGSDGDPATLITTLIPGTKVKANDIFVGIVPLAEA